MPQFRERFKHPLRKGEKEVNNQGVNDEIEHSVKAKKPRTPKKRRERFFSEKYPGAYSTMTAILPRIHTLTLGIVFIYYSLIELAARNYNFLLDWANRVPGLNIITEGIELYGVEEFFKRYWFIVAIMVVSVILVLYILHKVVWRWMFKDYFVTIMDKWGGTELTISRDGRLYWYTNNTWHRIWDNIYGSPVRTERKLWIQQKGKRFNFFNPPASLITVTIGPEEWMEARGVYGMIGHEKPVRHRVGRMDYTTIVTEFSTFEIPLEQASTVFNNANDRLVNETRKLTQGNAALRLDQMRDGGFVLSQKIREIVHAEKRTETAETEAATRPDS